MQLKKIKLFYQGLASITALLLVGSLYLHFFYETDLVQSGIFTKKRELPVSAFTLAPTAYASIAAPYLQLKSVPPQLHLPDLRSHLCYYGRNGRPDAALDVPKLQFGLLNTKGVLPLAPQQKGYLIYDKKLSSGCKYTFSPNNEETMVWFTAELEGNEAKVTLAMRDEEGTIISNQDGPGTFNLTEKEMQRQGQANWEIGKWRVDGTFLARQKAKWMGLDQFLEKFGGEEFSDILGKHRIDFGEADEAYFVFVRVGDCLAWDEDRWQSVTPGSSSVDKPLMVIKKIEERVMGIELWDVAGKAKVALNLIRTPEHFSPQTIASDFRFVGARTKTQVVFQINQERIIVKPHDWLLLTDEGWRKLKTIEEIDNYVNRKLIGPLFIFEEIAKKEDKPVLIGTIFNPSRTEMHPIEVSMASSNGSAPQQPATLPTEKAGDDSKVQVVTPIANH